MSADPQQHAPIVRLLSLMPSGKEVRSYVQRFSKLDQTRFAVIKAGGATLRDARAVLADQLAFLQDVGLTPVVVHGAGPQLDARLAEAGVAPQRIDGLRVTPPEALKVARDVFVEENLALVRAIDEAGAYAAAVPAGVFEAALIDEARFGLVGEPVAARLELIEAAAKSGAIPIVAPLGWTADGRLANINADSAVRALVLALQPYKVVFVTETGGVRDARGDLIQTINLATDYDVLMSSPWLAGGMRLKVAEIKKLLDALPLTSSVSMTKPDELAQELFTHGGAGTLLRRGERLIVADDKAAFEPAKVETLVAEAFGRAPAPDWWGGLDLARGYVSERYRAGAFVRRFGPAAYLDKYAVKDEARGEGLGQAVWRALTTDWPDLVWRSRADNPINDFYFRESDGAVRRGRWVVFWRGCGGLAQAADLVESVAALPASLVEAAS